MYIDNVVSQWFLVISVIPFFTWTMMEKILETPRLYLLYFYLQQFIIVWWVIFSWIVICHIKMYQHVKILKIFLHFLCCHPLPAVVGLPRLHASARAAAGLGLLQHGPIAVSAAWMRWCALLFSRYNDKQNNWTCLLLLHHVLYILLGER